MIGQMTDDLLVANGPMKNGRSHDFDRVDPAIAATKPRTFIDRIDVTVEAVLGGATLSVGALNALTADSVVKLDAALGALVDLRLNGAVVARGELVAVGDRFGVRIAEID